MKRTACFEEIGNHLLWELHLRSENEASVLLGRKKKLQACKKACKEGISAVLAFRQDEALIK